ncbi:MAG: histidine--tRNA ligase [Pseudomonadota bacterium]|nr:histidine--tRNA ligase [Pseudomonadota bacterium]
MAKPKKPARPKARLPRGLVDSSAADIRAERTMLDAIRAVYERYGFEPLETPAIEFTDALGKFLPDQDRPNEGVFSFQDDDEQWLSLRYDLTAPLARYVAENFNNLPKPFRRYQTGAVWRNEKPGPGRYRQFTQFDADTVGAPSVAADAEMCMLAADTMEALGFEKGQYVIKVNKRKVLDGVLESIGVKEDGQRLTVLRAIDKLDRLGVEGVRLLLGKGRKDESGDFTKGAGLAVEQVDLVCDFLFAQGMEHYEPSSPSDLMVSGDEHVTEGGWPYSSINTLTGLSGFFESSPSGRHAIDELEEMFKVLPAAGYGSKRIRFDPSCVRGLEYYTGPVFEAELTFEIKDDKGRPVRFGSVGGGGRYDGLIERFTGTKVPATGFSIGVSRLAAAMKALGKLDAASAPGPVVVTVFDKDRMADYQRMVQALRQAGIAAEMYLGNPKNMGQQFKYADQRGSPCVVIQGPDEKARGEVQIKDLIEGARLAEAIADNAEWRESRPAQFAVAEADLVQEVRKLLKQQQG